jgi:hypothetical protein
LRDIAGLQAAQLMHTNKEYQSAIQRISDRFLEIGENMTLVSKECAEYTSFDSEKQKIFFNSLKNNLSQARDQIRLFCEFNANFRRNVDEIIGLIDQINERYSNIKPLIDELEDRLKKRAEEENSRQTGGNMVAQMVQVGEDLKGNKEIIQDIFKDFEQHRNDLNKNVIKKISREEEDRCNELPHKIDNYLNRLNEMEEELVGKLKKNNELSDKIFREIQNSVNGIQYYEYFEQVIGEIIEELNTLNFNLKVNSEDEIDDKSENLKRLKEYYTMNTEFVIHDQITSGEEQQEEDLEVGEEEEGGDLELF